MGPKTRSMKHELVFDTPPDLLENITHTLDPIQKTFKTTHHFIPYWRYALYHRYVGNYTPQGISCTWTNKGKQNQLYNDQDNIDFNPVPSNLFTTVLDIIKTNTNSKLLKIHIYYTTCTILVQGSACPDWVDSEFLKLRDIVHTLASASRSEIHHVLTDVHGGDSLCISAPNEVSTADKQEDPDSEGPPVSREDKSAVTQDPLLAVTLETNSAVSSHTDSIVLSSLTAADDCAPYTGLDRGDGGQDTVADPSTTIELPPNSPHSQ